LKVDPGCCGDGAPIVADEVILDNQDMCTPCCDRYSNDVSAASGGGRRPKCQHCDETYYNLLRPGDPKDAPRPEPCYGKWYYTFVPKDNPWALGEQTLFSKKTGLPTSTDFVFIPVFGDGPFYMDPAGVSAMEYDVAALNGEVLHDRGPWMDAYGNMIVEVYDEYADEEIFPEYYLEPMMAEPILLANDWETDPFGPVTDIGRYRYSWWLEHGYLGDIFGHESEYWDVCCVCEDLCPDCEECPTESFLDTCEFPHYWDGGEALYAISPTDVRMNQGWPWSWVMAMYEWDLTSGINATQFDPNGVVTRGQMAGFMANTMKVLGVPDKAGTAFDDVPAGYVFKSSIEFLRAYNVVGGVGGNLYAPESPVTRAQMAIFIQNAFRAIKTYSGFSPWWDVNQNVFFPGTTFVDVPSNHWAHLQIEEMAFDGLTSGCKIEDGNVFYCPEDPVTRGQMATFITNAIATPDILQGFWPVFAPEK
jgi:hypothetical protein